MLCGNVFMAVDVLLMLRRKANKSDVDVFWAIKKMHDWFMVTTAAYK